MSVQGLLQAFVNYIVNMKTVQLEDLASEFNLRVQVRCKSSTNAHGYKVFLQGKRILLLKSFHNVDLTYAELITMLSFCRMQSAGCRPWSRRAASPG